MPSNSRLDWVTTQHFDMAKKFQLQVFKPKVIFIAAIEAAEYHQSPQEILRHRGWSAVHLSEVRVYTVSCAHQLMFSAEHVENIADILIKHLEETRSS